MTKRLITILVLAVLSVCAHGADPTEPQTDPPYNFRETRASYLWLSKEDGTTASLVSWNTWNELVVGLAGTSDGSLIILNNELRPPLDEPNASVNLTPTGTGVVRSKGPFVTTSSLTAASAAISGALTAASVTATTVTASAALRPATNNFVPSGSGSLRWSNIYSVFGDFLGTITASAGVSGTTMTLSGTAIASTLSTGNGFFELQNAAADSSTKGLASFTTNDFNDNGGGNISSDYTNGQKATDSLPGYMSATDHEALTTSTEILTAITPYFDAASIEPFGDSTLVGYTVSSGDNILDADLTWPAILGEALGVPVNNHGFPSTTLETGGGLVTNPYSAIIDYVYACEVTTRTLSVMMGINNWRYYGDTVGADDQYFDSLGAALAFLAIPETRKFFGEDATTVGTWSAEDTYSTPTRSIRSSSDGDTATFEEVRGRTVYIGCTRFLSGGGEITVSVDGVEYGPYSCAGAYANLESRTWMPFLIRIPNLPIGAHDVEIEVTTAGTCQVDWCAGSDGVQGRPLPGVYMASSFLSGPTDVHVAKHPANPVYNAIIEKVVHNLSADGLNVSMVPVAERFFVELMSFDDVHPSLYGHDVIADAFLETVLDVNNSGVNGEPSHGFATTAVPEFGGLGIGAAPEDAMVEITGAGTLGEEQGEHGTLKVKETAGSDFTAIDPNYGLILNRSLANIVNHYVGGQLFISTSNAASYDTNAIVIQPSGKVAIGGTAATTTTAQQMLDVITGNARIKAGVLQVGNATPAAYNRVGTATTDHSLAASTDTLLSGKLEVNGEAYFDGDVAVQKAPSGSTAFEVDSKSNDNVSGMRVNRNGSSTQYIALGSFSANQITGVGGNQNFVIQNANTGGTASVVIQTNGANDRLTVALDGTVTIAGDEIIIATSKTPASAGATGTTGMIAWDANYLYCCVATNTWKRVAIATW